ncbi:MAG: hypothetical protein ACOCQW_05845 [Halanaerobiaceae bacterium]
MNKFVKSMRKRSVKAERVYRDVDSERDKQIVKITPYMGNL